MKWWIAVVVLGLLSGGCRRNEPSEEAEPAAAAAPPRQRPSRAAGSDENRASGSGKIRQRPAETERKPPLAEPAAEMPGFVVSPFNGKLVDVRGIPAGTLVADPTYPASEKKYFRVPEMAGPPPDEVVPETIDLEGVEGTGEDGLPVIPLIARPVPGKAGFVFSPFNNKIIDVTGLEPGSVHRDPTYPPGEDHFFQIPEGVDPEPPPAPGE